MKRKKAKRSLGGHCGFPDRIITVKQHKYLNLTLILTIRTIIQTKTTDYIMYLELKCFLFE